MKKFIALAIVIALIAAVPWFVGAKVQKEFETQVQKVADYPGYKLEISEYNRGLLSSTAKLKVAYEIAAAPDGDEFEKKFVAALQEGFVVNFDISHGPLLSNPEFGAGMSYTVITLDDSQGFVQEAEKLFGVEELVIARTRFELNGEGTGSLQVPPLAYSEEDKSFNFGGVTLDLEFDDFGKKYRSNGTIQAFSMQAEKAQAESSPISISAEGAQGSSLYGTGTFSANLASLKISGEKSVQIENFNLSGNVSAPTSGLMDIDYKIELGKVSGSDMPHELKDAVVDIAIHNVRESAITQFSALGAEADLSNPETAVVHQQKMNTAITDLLAGSPELEIKQFAFKFGEDAWLDLSGNLGVDGEIAGKPEVQGNPFMLIPAITANYTANLSESIVEMAIEQYLSQQFADSGLSPEEIEQMTANQEQQTAMMIGQFVATGFLQKTDVGYRIETSFKSGELLVNGNPIPVPF